MLTGGAIRSHAMRMAFAPPASLASTMAGLGFVQADPIRAPARAQDLILRHRVSGYHAGELERRFAQLGLEEDFLYAYGFMPRQTAVLLHPRPDPDNPGAMHVPSGLAADILALVREQGPTHPRDLELKFGRDRTVNGWGGFSKATTHLLQRLHYHGYLRVAHRRDGIRVYEACAPPPGAMDPAERLHRLVMLVVRLLAPVSMTSLKGALLLMRRGAPGLGPMDGALTALLRSGELVGNPVDGEFYLWPASSAPAPEAAASHRVRFLAPFDPLVWDRRRFEHLWGWAYRFEAYTPAPQRRFGYYAMPLLWQGRMLGWVNLALQAGHLVVEPGYIGPVPQSHAFRRSFDAEVARFATFLQVR